MQLIAIPPRAHDINQCVEHANGCAKGYTATELSKTNKPLKEISDADVQDMVIKGAKLFKASSWRANTRRLVQCLRLLCTPADTKIDVQTTVQRNGVNVQTTVTSFGTDGNHCYKQCS